MREGWPDNQPIDEVRRYELGYAIAKEVLEEAEIPDISAYQPLSDENRLGSHFYQADHTADIHVHFEIGTQWGHINLAFSLMFVAQDFVSLIERVMSDELARTVLSTSVIYELQKRGITMLGLFDTKPEEVPGTVREVAKRALFVFLQNVPEMTRSSLVDAMGSTKLGYVTNILKPALREHWTNLGLPKDFNIVTAAELEAARKHHRDMKRWFLGDRKKLLRVEALADDVDFLRGIYKAARLRYQECKKSYGTLNRRAGVNEWEEKWTEICMEEFPAVPRFMRGQIGSRPPHELVYSHLGRLYGMSEEGIRKKLTISRKLKARHPRNAKK
jgi:hypothetical protein